MDTRPLADKEDPQHVSADTDCHKLQTKSSFSLLFRTILPKEVFWDWGKLSWQGKLVPSGKKNTPGFGLMFVWHVHVPVLTLWTCQEHQDAGLRHPAQVQWGKGRVECEMGHWKEQTTSGLAEGEQV